MKNYKKLKSFENYTGAGDDQSDNKPTKEQAKARIKAILEGVIETKMYFQMLKDSAENCYGMLQEILPSNIHAFANALYDTNEFLAEIVDELIYVIDASSMIEDMDEIILNIEKIEGFTEDNWDNVLSGNIEDEDEEDDFEEEEENEENEEDVEDDSKQQHNLPIGEAKKNLKDLEDFVKKYRKTEKFFKGEIVYLNGITAVHAKKLNGKKAEIVKKSENKEDCYDLFVPSIPSKEKGEANLKGMPAKFIQKEKVEERFKSY